MNTIDNGVEKFISVVKVDTEYRLGWEVTFIDYYGKECKCLLSHWQDVERFKSEKYYWTE